MTDKRLYRVAGVAVALTGCLSSNAQLHESISVEGKYVPEVIRVDRVNVFPAAVGFTLDSTPMEYEWGGVAASFSPYLLHLPATGWRDTKKYVSNKGYLEFGIGSWLNSTLSAGYRFVDNSNTLVGIRLQHNSTSLWKPHLSEATYNESQYRYDESVGLYASHLVSGVGRFDAAFDYHVGLFNYYGSVFPTYDTEKSLPKQTVNDVALRLDWKSIVSSTSSPEYNAMLRIHHFGFRTMPLPFSWNYPTSKGNRETNIELAAGVKMPWNNGSTVGLDADLNVLVYGGKEDVFTWSYPGFAEETLKRPDNYGMLTLTPFYRFNQGLLDLRIGADIDLSFNAGPEGNHYSFFHIAPDMKFALQSGGFGMYLNILGGSELNTLAALRQYDYYMMPALTTTRPTYTPFDASFGINVGPFAGFSMGANIQYRASRNVPLGGWYQAWLNYGGSLIEGMDAFLVGSERMQYSLNTDGINLHGYSVGGNIMYEPSSSLRFKAEGNWQPQKGKKGFFNGYDRPRVTARLEASVKPIEPLRITLGYDYRGVRNIYTTSAIYAAPGGVSSGDNEPVFHSLRLPDLTLFNVSASWSVSPSFSVWLQGDNLLNRHDAVLPCLPTQGVVVTGGMSILIN
ncbi:MAG: hypothetical protein HDR88_04995 [Bacteroides sp.]|nr:hypothetical protein [Bacteroides sp.]